MADQKISARTSAGTLDGTEIVGLIQAGLDRKATAQDIADLGGGGVTTVKVSLSSAQILALFTTPVTLVPAAGAGTVIVPLRVLISFAFNSVAYTTNTSLILALGTLFQSTMAGAVGFSTDELATYTVTTNAGSSSPAASVNTPLLLSAASGNPAAGNSTFDIYVTYIVITL